MDNRPAPRGRGRGIRPSTVPTPGAAANGTTTTDTSTSSALTRGHPSSSDVQSFADRSGRSATATSLSAVTGALSRSNLEGSSSSSNGGSAGASASSDTPAAKPKLPLIEVMRRPGHGTSGTPMELRSNFFRLYVGAEDKFFKLHHYRIEVTHEKKTMKPDELRELFWETMVGNDKLFQCPWLVVYDGGNSFYCEKKLEFPGQSSNFETTHFLSLSNDMRRNRYKVKISHIGPLHFRANQKTDDSAPSGAFNSTNFLDLMFRQFYSVPTKIFEEHMLEKKAFVNAGRSNYLLPRDNRDIAPLGRNCEAWRGYFASTKMCIDGGLHVNFDTSYTPFYSQRSMLQFLCETLNSGMNTDCYQVALLRPDTALSAQHLKLFEKEVKGVKIVTNHLPPHREQTRRIWKVLKVTERDAYNILFEKRPPLQKGQTPPPKDQAGESMNVAQYFADTYRPLKHPYLPCVVVGSKSRNVYFPLEVCEISQPQKYSKKLSDTQTSAMIKAACTDAPTRQRNIMEMYRTVNFDKDKFLCSHGVKVDTEMAKFRARKLDRPEILYDNNKRILPAGGVWSIDRQRFYQPSTGPQAGYGFISFMDQRHGNSLQKFCQILSGIADQLGIRLFGMPQHIEFIRSASEIESVMKMLVAKQCTFFLFALERKNSQFYAEIKRVGDVMFGVVTQCVLAKAINACQTMTLSNIALKINAKMGGINNMIVSQVVERYLTGPSELTMVMGIDVTHPGPTDRHSPSIAAVIANVEPIPARFGASIKVQKFRREGLVNLAEAIRERIYDFYQKCGKAPRRMLIYRDGVSEGQFSDVLNEELVSVRKACSDLSPGFKPSITFVVVQKRHHTRFFCVNRSDTCGKANNVPPGTIVDNHITHPTNYDFYLCSHFGIQGTSRPAHYHVLIDENNFSVDELQIMTFHMCHMYARCTRSVSVPAPVYYAHLACARARYHLFKLVGGDDTSSQHSGGEATSATSEESLTKACRVNELLRDKMYFC